MSTVLRGGGGAGVRKGWRRDIDGRKLETKGHTERESEKQEKQYNGGKNRQIEKEAG